MDFSFVGDGFPVPYFRFSYNDKSGGETPPLQYRFYTLSDV